MHWQNIIYHDLYSFTLHKTHKITQEDVMDADQGYDYFQNLKYTDTDMKIIKSKKILRKPHKQKLNQQAYRHMYTLYNM